MGNLNLDFTGVGNDFNISEGEHIFRVEDVEVVVSKNGTSNNLKCKVTVEGGEDDGKSINHFVSLHEKALWSAKLFLEALTGEEIEGEIDIDTDQLVGLTFRGFVIKTEDGKYSNIDTVEAV